MARKNRIVIEDGMYHCTSRIAHREYLLKNPELKDKIVEWIYGIADFSGLTVLCWTILDNHLHIYLRVPTVPGRFWLADGTVPEGPSASAFSMRPRECRAPRWQPDLADLDAAEAAGEPLVISPAGDSPSREAVRVALADGVPAVTLLRPSTGFTMTDEEMIGRLEGLYAGHSNGASLVRRRWARLRLLGRGEEVEAEKEAFCRRMYNVSQYMKALKQRISEYCNREFGHSGALWDGRFYSGVVEDDPLARLFTVAYIDWNAPKAKLVKRPQDWAWCSFAAACGNGPFAERARKGYETALGCPWEEARARLEAVFAQKLPDTYDPQVDCTRYAVAGPDGKAVWMRLSLAQLVKSAETNLFRGAFFGRHADFAKKVLEKLPKRFPAPSARRLGRLVKFDWSEPVPIGRHAA